VEKIEWRKRAEHDRVNKGNKRSEKTLAAMCHTYLVEFGPVKRLLWRRARVRAHFKPRGVGVRGLHPRCRGVAPVHAYDLRVVEWAAARVAAVVPRAWARTEPSTDAVVARVDGLLKNVPDIQRVDACNDGASERVRD